MAWNDFNDAPEQVDRDALIPMGTKVKVVMKVRPGGHDDPAKGWTGGYMTRSTSTGSVYLDCEYTIIGGPFAKRKVWSMHGMYSAKAAAEGKPDTYAAEGRSFLRAALESARGIKPDDASERAMKARQAELSHFDGLEFVAKIGIEKGQNGYADKNVIKYAVPVTDRDYQALMSGAGTTQTASAAASQLGQQAKSGTPAWMQQ